MVSATKQLIVFVEQIVVSVAKARKGQALSIEPALIYISLREQIYHVLKRLFCCVRIHG